MTATAADTQRVADHALDILMVAPQPFFRPRGTPFSVLHRARALGALGHRIELLTYPFGEDVSLPGVRIRRSARVPFVRDVKIGPSLAKLALDVPLAWSTWRALHARRFDLVHSHEEAAFFCAPLARLYRLPHVYDMHSSLPQQLDNFRSFNLGPLRRLFSALERHVLSSCQGVITICRDLALVAERHVRAAPHAMIENTADDAAVFAEEAPGVELQELHGRAVVLYTGTLETYQGIDLLLEAFVRLAAAHPTAHLALVGGRPPQVQAYEARARALGIAERVTFVGQVHPRRIPGFVAAADLIVSPRSGGTNTPLKIYGYLRSGRPIVATDLYTHTQTLNERVSELVAPTPEGLAAGMARVLGDPQRAGALARAARELSDAEYSEEAYLRKVGEFYRGVIG